MIRIEYFLYLIVPFAFFMTKSGNRLVDCRKVHNGSFYYYSKTVNERIEIERIDSLQIETITSNGHVLRSRVIWNSPCTFIMNVNYFSASKLSAMDSFIASIPAYVTILKVTDQYYISKWNASINNKEIEGIDTMYIKEPTHRTAHNMGLQQVGADGRAMVGGASISGSHGATVLNGD